MCSYHSSDSWFNRSFSSIGKCLSVLMLYWLKYAKVSCLLRGCSFYLADQSNHILLHVWSLTTPPLWLRPQHTYVLQIKMLIYFMVHIRCWGVSLLPSLSPAPLTLINEWISWRNRPHFTPKSQKITIMFCLNKIKPILGFCLLLLLIYEFIVMSVMHITCKLLLNFDFH